MLVPLAVALAVLAAGCAGSTGDTSSGTIPTTAARASGPAGLPAATVAQAEQFLGGLVTSGYAPGIMVQVTTPDGTWSDAFGVASKATGAPMSPDLRHRIGSVTKTFTTTLALMLVQEGKLDLDDPVSKYVAGVPDGDRITIRMLGSMTSGLNEYLGNPEFRAAFAADPARTWQPQELLDAAYAMGPVFAPGTSSAYSNANTVLLGLVIEAIEGRAFGEVITEKILVPQGLDGTTYPTDARFPQDHTSGHSTLQPGVDEVDSTSWSPTQAQAAGQMISTIADLTTWARLLATGELISPALQAERMRWERMGDNDDEWHYTFGIEENSGWLGHNGMIPGYFTYVVYHPELRASIVIAMNTDRNREGEPGINPIMRELSEILFPGHPVRVPVVA